MTTTCHHQAGSAGGEMVSHTRPHGAPPWTLPHLPQAHLFAADTVEDQARLRGAGPSGKPHSGPRQEADPGSHRRPARIPGVASSHAEATEAHSKMI